MSSRNLNHSIHYTTHPMRTLNAPSGVTNIGGANEYAAKLATVYC
jgi:hypothetical protein